jgi:hypothetical protein
MLAEQPLHPLQVLPQAIDFTQCVFVIVGRFGQKGDHFGAVEAAKDCAELLLTQIERRHAHQPFRGRRT